jgi:hypothetical protein
LAQFNAHNGRVFALVLRQDIPRGGLLRETGYADEGGLGLVATGPCAGRVILSLALLTRVLDSQEQRPAVRGEGRSGQLGLHGSATSSAQSIGSSPGYARKVV